MRVSVQMLHVEREQPGRFHVAGIENARNRHRPLLIKKQLKNRSDVRFIREWEKPEHRRGIMLNNQLFQLVADRGGRGGSVLRSQACHGGPRVGPPSQFGRLQLIVLTHHPAPAAVG